jgi:hypothetical protein
MGCLTCFRTEERKGCGKVTNIHLDGKNEYTLIDFLDMNTYH